MSRTSSRRAALAAGTASPPREASRPLARAASPDAALLALCRRFHAGHAEGVATLNGEDMSEPHARRRSISDRIEATPARTPAGKAAKAGVALLMLQECGDPGQSGSWERMVVVALAEAAGLLVPPEPTRCSRPSPVPVPAAVPDAALVFLCAEAIAAEAAFSAFLRDTSEAAPGFRAEESRLRDPLSEYEDRIADMPARTLGGLRAKVLAARAAYPSGLNSERLAESILSDVMALTAPEGARA